MDTDDGALEWAIEELYCIEQRSGWGRVQAIASVVQRLRGSGKDGAKQGQDLSWRRLAAHPRCPLSKSQLRDALEAYRVFSAEPDLQRSKFLTPSHAAAVSCLDAPLRGHVLRAVEEAQLSVRELVEQVRDLRRHRGERRGRPPTSSAEKAVTRLDNAAFCLSEARELLLDGAPGEEALSAIFRQLAKIRESEEAILDLIHEADAHGLPLVTRESSPPESGVTDISRAGPTVSGRPDVRTGELIRVFGM